MSMRLQSQKKQKYCLRVNYLVPNKSTILLEAYAHLFKWLRQFSCTCLVAHVSSTYAVHPVEYNSDLHRMLKNLVI